MSHRIARHAIHARGRVDLLDAIDIAQFLRCDLSGSGLLGRAHRGKGERAARADSQHPADDSLLPHAQPDQGVLALSFSRNFIMTTLS